MTEYYIIYGRNFKYIFKKIFILLCISGWIITSDYIAETARAQNKSFTIESVKLSGNENFSTQSILEGAGVQLLVNSDSSGTMSILENILDFYRSSGYQFCEIYSIELNPLEMNNNFELGIAVAEGPKFLFGDVIVADSGAELKEEIEAFLPGKGSPFNYNYFESGVHDYLAWKSENGFPYLIVNVEDIGLSSSEKSSWIVDIYVKLENIEVSIVDSVIVSGNEYTQKRVIIRESRLRIGDPVRERSLKKAREYLQNLSYIAGADTPELYLLKKNRNVVELKISERKSNRFSGIAGYVPGTLEKSGYYIGSFEFDMGNLLGTGRKLYASWDRPDRSSQNLKILYEEPWVFNVPLNLLGGFEQELQDSSFIKRTFSIGGSYSLSSSMSTELSFGAEQVIAEEEGKRLYGLQNSNSRFYTAGITYNSMENRLNPFSGVYYITRYVEQRRTVSNGPDTPNYKVHDRKINSLAEIAFTSPGSKNVVLFTRGGWNQTQTSGGDVPVSQQWYLGGAASLRGFREKQFLAESISWYNLELRYLLDRDSRIFIFQDGGFFTGSAEKLNRKFGYGFGLRVRTPLGLVGFDLGLGKGDPFSEAKLHVMIQNLF
ncbi:BamA/TamA family outer membrane protein [candidate division KSB1 bacterium]